jgi:hypothetical protein
MQADHQDKPEDLKRGNGRKGKSQVSRRLLYAEIFVFLAAWASLLGNLGHTYWIFAACVMLAASVCGALSLRLELRNHHRLKWQYNGAACLLVAIAFVIGVPVITREACRNEPKEPAQITKWLPLELRQGCSNVVVWFGGEGHIFPIWRLQQSPPCASVRKGPHKNSAARIQYKLEQTSELFSASKECVC